MNTAKLQDALAELMTQRGVLDGAISHLESALRILSSASGQVTGEREHVAMSTATAPLAIVRGGVRSYIDDAELLLQQEMRPIHARDLADGISKIRGKQVARTSVESTLLRHVADLKDRARIAKVGPSLYGLPGWPQHEAADQKLLDVPSQHLTA